MMVVECRFDVAPAVHEIEAVLRELLGPRGAAMFDAIEVTDHAVRAFSMDPVALVYADRALVSLGGRAVGVSGAPREIAWPWWSERPWTSLSVWQRFRARLSAFSL